MKYNIIDKIWRSHVISHEENHPYVINIDKMLLHEVTSSQAFSEIRRRSLTVKYPERIIATIDHSIPTSIDRKNIKDINANIQINELRKNANEYGIDIYDIGSGKQGIVHVIGPELGFTLPGETIVCGDSHTSTHGAFGALAFGIGTSEVAHVLATGAMLQYKPKTMKIEFIGKISPAACAKDMIMKLISEIGVGGGKGYVIEYTGDAVKSLSMEGRMTLCNMSIECGARAGLIAPDETTFDYLKGREYAPKNDCWDKLVGQWCDISSDDGAQYDKIITVDVDDLQPLVTWGINPEQAVAVNGVVPDIKNAGHAYSYTKLTPGDAIQSIKIDWVFIGSCTNGRIEDLRMAAKVLKGNKIADSVSMYVVPGSEKVRLQAIKEGIDKVFIDAGAEFRMPGCSMCLAMNGDKVPAGSRCVSTSNRNFIGRQGRESITHLASPATAAASAIKGRITGATEILR